ncbi:ketopantoate reductase family protein [Nitrincola alkalilacustris]|uniref:ketopantoate reductase family protein n=1 Tax=Nitrincola alkalilacustris TaxID=1571224 RepID=UPI00124D1EF1|nr:2-dehydropantoate 2-reductase [Nitrincola alkalilacustris]
MHWYILGAGAIGCLCAELLCNSGAKVTFILRNQSQLQTFNQAGRQIRLRDGDTCCSISVDASAAADNAEIRHLLVTTKAYDTLPALSSIQHRLAPDAQIVLLQNGCGQQQEVARLYFPRQIWAGITTHGAWREAPFQVVRAGIGQITLGPLGTSQLTLPDGWEKIDAAIIAEPDIKSALWRKLAINCAINPLTAIQGCRNGDLLTDPKLSLLMRGICDEIEQIAHARGQQLFTTPLFDAVCEIALLTADNFSSMLQDLRQERQTEIEQITGFLCREAAELGMTLPHNQRLLDQIRSQQNRHYTKGEGSE